MEQKDKELVLKDLCARQPYNTQIQGTIYEDILDNDGEETGKVEEKTVTFNLYIIGKDSIMYNGYWISLDLCKPYLRPMSSMTKEELYEVQKILGKGVEIQDDFISIIDSSINSFTYLELQAVFDWLNAHHFDYRGLIEKGLALEASKDMYVTNQ